MISVPLTVRFLVATGTAAALVGCSSGAGSGDRSESPPASSTTGTPVSGATDDAAKAAYLAAVNALCDALLPAVVEATHGGSIDVPAKEWVQTWPAHKRLLDGFDAELAKVEVPPAAAGAARAMSGYQAWATAVDERRIAAARQGENAWRAEVAAEADLTDA